MNVMIEILSPVLYKKLVFDRRSEWSYRKMVEPKVNFSNFPACYYTTDIRFHQTLRPMGNNVEAKPYLSAKHKLFGVKTEVSVLPNGLCVRRGHHRRGGVADRITFNEAQSWHKARLFKKND